MTFSSKNENISKIHYKFDLLLGIINATLLTRFITELVTDNHHCLKNLNFHFAQQCIKNVLVICRKLLSQSNFSQIQLPYIVVPYQSLENVQLRYLFSECAYFSDFYIFFKSVKCPYFKMMVLRDA